MVTNSNLFSGPYPTDGHTTSFPVTFPFFDQTDIAVWQVNTAATTAVQLVLNTNYTVAGAGNPDGGNIVTVGLLIPVGYTIVILRNEPLVQDTGLSDQAAFYPDVIEEQFDRCVEMCQMLQEEINRAFKVAPGQPPVPPCSIVTSIVTVANVSESITKTLIGAAQANVVFGAWTADVNCYVDQVQIDAYAGAPTGTSLIAQVLVNGVLQTDQFVLPAGSNFQQAFPTSPTHIFVPVGATVTWIFTQVGGTAPGNNVGVTIRFRAA